jgi:hypothetical protein
MLLLTLMALFGWIQTGFASECASWNWTIGFGSFSEGNWPGCWKPYGGNSVWNYPLSRAPKLKLHPDSDAIVSRTLTLGNFGKIHAGTSGKNLDWSKPTYYSQSTDPLFTVRCTADYGTCPIEGARIRIPDAAQPAAGGDHHITVVDQSSYLEYDFWNVTMKEKGGGQLIIGWGGGALISGNGLGSAATAPNFGNLGGIIRAEEFEAQEIQHALFLVINCTGNNPRFVFPAEKGERICEDPTNAPSFGTHFYLAMTDDEITNLGVPAWKVTLLRAMARFGLFFGDTGGDTSFGLQAESGSTYTSFGYPDRLLEFAIENGWSPGDNGTEWEGIYSAVVETGVDWKKYLKVLDPCVSQRNCV